MVMGVFYIDFEHARDMFQICKWASGIDETNMVFAAKNVCQPRWFS